jgi:hypothetical protein
LNSIAAREVPIARCMIELSGNWRREKRKNKAGTVTNPPPIPNDPAIRPAVIPIMMYAK